MVVVVAVVVVLALVGGAAWIMRRRGSDESHSVEGYRNTLDTLQGIRSRSSSTSVRVLGGASEPTPPSETAAGPAPVDGAHGFSGRTGEAGSRGLVFEDPALREGSGGPGTFGGRRTQDRAMSAMNHRSRRLGAPVLVALVVLVLLVVVVVVGARAQHHHNTTSSTTATTARSTHSTKTSTTKAPAGSGKSHSTTTTTAAPTSFTAANPTATSGTYTPPAASYTVTLTTTGGDCWVTVKSSTGASIYSATMSPGQSKSLPITGTSTIILGAPSAVTVTLDHEPVVLPTGYQTPFTVTLQPAAT